MSSTLVKTLNLAHEFALASQRKDITHIAQLLSEMGEFEIQDDALETYAVGKAEFLTWYANKLEQTVIHAITYDQCLHCQIGARVVLFNDGKFPRKIKDSSERIKAGYKVDAVDDTITDLKFCFVLMQTENPYKFECEIDRIKTHLGNGVSILEIREIMQREDDSERD